MYYAFWCHTFLRTLYSTIALGMFALAIAVQIPRLNVSMNGKVAVLLLWSAYGIIPLGHWAVAMGGLENELVRVGISWKFMESCHLLIHHQLHFAADGAPHRGHVLALPRRLRFLCGQDSGALVHRQGGLRWAFAQLVAPDHRGRLLSLAQHRTGLCRVSPE